MADRLAAAIVDSGIHVNPEKCFGWMDLRCSLLLESLVEHGLKIK
jgi:hypothetical protein